MLILQHHYCSIYDVIVYGRNELWVIKSTWSIIELTVLRALNLVESGCFTDRETLQLATSIK